MLALCWLVGVSVKVGAVAVVELGLVCSRELDGQPKAIDNEIEGQRDRISQSGSKVCRARQRQLRRQLSCLLWNTRFNGRNSVKYAKHGLLYSM